MKRIVLAAVLAGLLATQTHAADAPPPASNPDMKRLFDADQADRANNVMAPGASDRDAERRTQTRQLLAQGALHTGLDFMEAAFVFQHGHGDDFLLAHTLAVVATKKGDAGGPWIAAATLDRYLQSHGHKQIYGTQYFGNGATGEWSQEPYDRDLISDALRAELNVKDQAAQQAQLAKYQASAVKAPPAPVVTAAAPVASPGHVDITCGAPTVERVFVRAKWRIEPCGDKGFMAMAGPASGEGAPDNLAAMAVLFVVAPGDKVNVTRVDKGTGGDAAEVKVATAAFEAMSPAQVADIAAQAKAAK